jgi:hypothetical protein
MPHRIPASDGVFDQGFKLTSLLVSDRRLEVLHCYRALADEDPLGDRIDTGHPGVANQLWIQCRNAIRLLRIAGGGRLPLRTQGVLSSSPTASTKETKLLPELSVRVNRIC